MPHAVRRKGNKGKQTLFVLPALGMQWGCAERGTDRGLGFGLVAARPRVERGEDQHAFRCARLT